MDQLLSSSFNYKKLVSTFKCNSSFSMCGYRRHENVNMCFTPFKSSVTTKQKVMFLYVAVHIFKPNSENKSHCISVCVVIKICIKQNKHSIQIQRISLHAAICKRLYCLCPNNCLVKSSSNNYKNQHSSLLFFLVYPPAIDNKICHNDFWANQMKSMNLTTNWPSQLLDFHSLCHLFFPTAWIQQATLGKQGSKHRHLRLGCNSNEFAA